MRIASILFDLDGTLVDSSAGIEYSCRAALQAVLPGQELPDLRRRIGPPLREIFRQALAGVPSEILDDLERHFRVSYDSEGWQKTVTYPGVASTLRRLSELGVHCFVITNKPLLPTQRILCRLGLQAYLKEVVCPNSATPPFGSKVEAVAYLLSKHGLDAKSAVIVGDSEDDARAAEACGLSFVGVAYGYGRPHARPGPVADAVILPEFSRLLELVASHETPGQSATHPARGSTGSGSPGGDRTVSHGHP